MINVRFQQLTMVAGAVWGTERYGDLIHAKRNHEKK